MNYSRIKAREGIAIASIETTLRTFLDPSCAVAIWSRQIPPNVQVWLDKLPPENLPRARIVVPPYAVAKTVARCFDTAGMPAGRERDWLEGDIAAMAAAFAELMSTNLLRVRLSVVENNACRKFHRDALTGRLVCTYRGTGTQYGYGTNDNDPEEIFTVPTGSPILLRGSHWPAVPDHGVLHRSPPIEGTGESRFVLVLDPVPEDELADAQA